MRALSSDKQSVLIRDYGGKVAITVSGKPRFLVKGVDIGPIKIRKTLERNVRIMDARHQNVTSA